MFKNIVVATDGSDHARKAVRVAAEMAALSSAALTIVNAVSHRDVPDSFRQMAEVEHLVDPPRTTFGELGVLTTADLGAARRARLAQVVSDKLLEQARMTAEEAGVASIETLSLDTDPADAILEQIDKAGADLVVLGTRGLGQIEGLFLGSVSHKLVQTAPCACLTVK